MSVWHAAAEYRMTRALRQLPADPHRDFVRRITDLHAEVQRAGQVALERAREARTILLGLTRPERANMRRGPSMALR